MKDFSHIQGFEDAILGTADRIALQLGALETLEATTPPTIVTPPRIILSLVKGYQTGASKCKTNAQK